MSWLRRSSAATLVTMLLLMSTRNYRFVHGWISAATRTRSSQFFALSRSQSSFSASSSYYKTLNKTLVSVQDCLSAFQEYSHERNDDLVFVDASWYHKGGRNGRTEFEQGPRIVGARYIDMDDIATSSAMFPELNPKKLRTMLPPKSLFAQTMDALDISNTNHIIIYAKNGTYFTPRTWFLFKCMGHDAEKIHLMQGSLEDWIQAGGPIETEPKKEVLVKDFYNSGKRSNNKNTTCYVAQDPPNVIDMKAMQSIVQDGNAIILDSRGSSFAKGHIPGARHVPYSCLVQPNRTLALLDSDQLMNKCQQQGVNIHQSNQPIVCSCGSGVSACHLLLALQECGRDIDVQPTFLYDGSYQEWGDDPDTAKTIPT